MGTSFYRVLVVIFFFGLGSFKPAYSQWTKEDSTYIFQQLSLAFSYAYNKPDSAKELANIVFNHSKKVKYKYGQMKSLNILGILEDVTGNYDSSLSLYFKARAIAKQLKDSLMLARIGINIGLIYWNQEKQDTALIWYKASEKYFRKVNNQKSLASAINNIALIYDDKDRPDKSILLHFEALKIRQELQDSYGIGASMHNISMAYTFLNKDDSAIIWGMKAIPFKVASNDVYGLSKTYNNLALAYSHLNNYDSAIVNSKKAIELKIEIGDMYGLASSYNNLASMYMEDNQLNKAGGYLNKGLEIAKKKGYKRVLNELYRNKAKLADYSENYQLASAFKDSLIKYNKHLYVKETNDKLQKLQIEFEVERKESKIEALNLENKLEKQKVEQKNTQLYAAIAVGMLLLLTSMLAFLSFRRKQKLNLIIEKQKGNTAMLEAIEEERKQIAVDLHDGIGQQLAAIKLAWENALTKYKKGIVTTVVEEQKVAKLINNTVSDIRSLSHRMMPRALENQGLIPAIEEMLSMSLDAKKMSYKFEHFQVKTRLDKKLEVSLYRIMQELLKNIIKHSQATEVHVQLMQIKKQLVLIVEDNGVGINSNSKQKSGIGLLSLKNRVDSFHGKINFEPSPQSGTLVTIRIPIN